MALSDGSQRLWRAMRRLTLPLCRSTTDLGGPSKDDYQTSDTIHTTRDRQPATSDTRHKTRNTTQAPPNTLHFTSNKPQ